MKYFYYISEQKVSMLESQAKSHQFTIRSIGSKIGLGALSFSLGVENTGKNLVQRTKKLVQTMEEAGNILPVGVHEELNTSSFYHDNGRWKHGLFKLDSICEQPTVTYAMWRLLNNSLILLVGSPNNILGEKIVKSECFVPGTSGAHIEILEYVDSFLKTDEVVAVEIEHAENFGGPTDALEASSTEIDMPKPFGSKYDRFKDFDPDAPTLSEYASDNRGVTLAFLCLHELASLPESNVDTVFRVFSEYKIPDSVNDYEKWQRSTFFSQWKPEDRYKMAKRLGVLEFERVYLGSPVYVALA